MVTKAAVIRQYLAKHPELKATELMALINKDNPKVKVQTSNIYNVLANDRKKSSPARREAPSNHSGSFLLAAAKLKEAVQILGPEDAKKVIDLFAK